MKSPERYYIQPGILTVALWCGWGKWVHYLCTTNLDIPGSAPIAVLIGLITIMAAISSMMTMMIDEVINYHWFRWPRYQRYIKKKNKVEAFENFIKTCKNKVRK